MKPTGHRNLYNGDCTFLFGKSYLLSEHGPFTTEVLHRYIDMLAASGVDTYLCNTTAQKPWHPSKVQPSVISGYTRGDREFIRGHYPPPNDTDFSPARLEEAIDGDIEFLNRYLDLAEAGVNWAAEIAAACRRNSISPWATVRMNDAHGANSWERSYHNGALLADPRYRLKGLEINPRRGCSRWLTLLNYEHREVRDYYFSMIKEIVEEYDFEGLELDWLRSPFCCEPPAGQDAVDTITAWIADIRALTQKRAEQTGKPYLLGLRLPVRLGAMKAIGLDVVALARADLIDFASFSNSWQTTWDVPHEQIRAELGDKVAIYGAIEDAPNAMPALEPNSGQRGYRLLSTSPELLRGNAANKLVLGADGIATFNFFCSDEIGIHPNAEKHAACYPALRDLHSLETLRGKPKHYALAARPGLWEFSFFEYAEQLPSTIEPQGWRAFRLSMCAEPPASVKQLAIQLVIEKQAHTPPMPDLGVSFNSSWPNFDAVATSELLFPTGMLTHHIPEHTAFNYTFDPALIREGWNEVLVVNDAREPGQSLRIVSVELAVT